MGILFINAAFREGSRTHKLAEAYLKDKTDKIDVIELGDIDIHPLNRSRLAVYNKCFAERKFDDEMFDYAKQLREADEIVIAAPFWNNSIPAVLHDYIELACAQGVSFDIDESGTYFTMTKAKKLVYITTAGGMLPEDDHAFGYIESLAKNFWHIPEIKYIKADGLDIAGVDVNKKLNEALENANA